MGTRVTVKEQVTIPKAAREAAGIAPGDEVEVRAVGPGQIVVMPSNRRRRFEAAIEEIRRNPPKLLMTGDEAIAMRRDDD